MLTSDWKGVTGPANVVRRRFRNIEVQAASIAGHEQIYAQLTPGLFDGGLESYAISERTAFFVETTNRSIRKRFQVLPGHLPVGFLLGEFTCHGNGVPLAIGDTSVNLSSTPTRSALWRKLSRLLADARGSRRYRDHATS
jgi:hypothetical protein